MTVWLVQMASRKELHNLPGVGLNLPDWSFKHNQIVLLITFLRIPIVFRCTLFLLKAEKKKVAAMNVLLVTPVQLSTQARLEARTLQPSKH